MRATKVLVVMVVFAALVAACGSGGNDPVSVDTDHSRPELLYLGSGSAITALAPKHAHVRFQEQGAVPSRDWSVLYAATTDGATTTLRTLDPATGEERASRTVPGAYTVRVVSEDGAMVALTPVTATGVDTYHPSAKDPTPLVIVRRNDPEPQVLSVPGNVEPEAFSLSGDALFVVDFVPPLAPERYRVARLDLRRGAVDDVRSNEEELQEPMRGTARSQAMAPDGRRLYTLYTRDATPTEPAEAFVHVLDLDEETATCVDLPPEFARDPLGAVAVSPAATRAYVYAPAVGKLAELDTKARRVTRTADVPLPAGPTGLTTRATATESTLYLTLDHQFTPVALDTLSPGAWVASRGPIIGIQPASNGDALYVALADRVYVYDRRRLAPEQTIVVPTPAPIDYLPPALPPIPSDGYVKCAC